MQSFCLIHCCKSITAGAAADSLPSASRSDQQVHANTSLRWREIAFRQRCTIAGTTFVPVQGAEPPLPKSGAEELMS